MKLLLTSGGLSNSSIINALKELAQKPFSELNLAFIPTASNIEEGDKSWLIDDLETCKDLKFKSIDIVDISALPQELWYKRLQAADIFLVEGGNTYYLMHWVKKSGLREVLPELLKSRIYVGISAGSMIPNPTIILSSSEKSFVETTGVQVSDEGLGLVNFLIEPHINSPYFPDSTFGHIERIATDLKYPVYAIDDETAIRVVDDQIAIISEGAWKLFNKKND